jgi:hypothetical protein
LLCVTRSRAHRSITSAHRSRAHSFIVSGIRLLCVPRLIVSAHVMSYRRTANNSWTATAKFDRVSLLLPSGRYPTLGSCGENPYHFHGTVS